jgi:hypothetical protein
MPITKTILKKVRQQAVVKFVGDGTANVDLIADLKLSDETPLDPAIIRVNINRIYFSNSDSTGNPITIKRNNSNVLVLNGNDNWLFTQHSGFSDTSNNSANVVITIPAPGGTVVIGLTKENGFVEPDQQNFVSGN